MQRLLQNHQLSVAVQSWLHPDLLTHLDSLRDIAEAFKKNAFAPNVTQTLNCQECGALDWLWGCRVDGSVYRVPFLAPAFCDMIIAETADWPFTGNEQEPEHLRCPEAVLHEVCPQLGRVVAELHRAALTPLYSLIHGAIPTSVAAAQLTRYTLARNSFGGWHQDQDSDFTAVVELAPELHTGGGTDLMLAALEVTSVPTLAKGHALLFPGKTTHHRGRPITQGVRDLLVFWTETQ
ncbi:MAG: hypothetical protein [Bacteriophage sp.]|nr:MAG: hypothetical protein [Bacteriophage sp.]